jgi:hypothetical protein
MYTRKLPVRNDGKIESGTQTHFIENVTKQHIKIKIITYLSLITKASKRYHLNMFCCGVQKCIYIEGHE